MHDAPSYPVPLDRLNATISYINELRRQSSSPHRAAETIASNLFGAENRLAMYGSLVPGEENHDIIAPVAGTWTTGYVRGDFYDRGWSAGLGYPALRWRTDGPPVRVHVLTASNLSEHWNRLDDFEGSDYRRILIPVFLDDDALIVCNLYELRHDEN